MDRENQSRVMKNLLKEYDFIVIGGDFNCFGNPGWGYDDVLPYFKKSQDQRNPFLAQNTTYHSTDNITSGIETSIQFYEKMLFTRGYLTVQDPPFNTPLGPTYLQVTQEMRYNIVDI
uniref:Uncharacterized protein n=1 Tax=Vespula pensylvanica TaxID=30213 RepID=A0A834P7G8_VESPE|nr:hypothetical protein H0235_004510 [Vespula pensylvanica]